MFVLNVIDRDGGNIEDRDLLAVDCARYQKYTFGDMASCHDGKESINDIYLLAASQEPQIGNSAK